jgi:hypothetical protein
MHATLPLLLALAALPALAQPAGGLSWTAPRGWSPGEARPMRAATYAVPATKGDPEAGECAVFFFGGGQGGGVEDNLRRWAGQFEGAQPGPRRTETIRGVKVTRIELEGTYQSGGMNGPKVARPGFKLLGAIAEGKEGNVFFKLTGPARTVEAARADFEALLQSLRAP